MTLRCKLATSTRLRRLQACLPAYVISQRRTLTPQVLVGILQNRVPAKIILCCAAALTSYAFRYIRELTDQYWHNPDGHD